MSAPAGRTLFKKKDGILTFTVDHQAVVWTPNTGGSPTVSLPVSSIINLQQTPDTSPKVMLKIFEKSDKGADPITYLFHFNTTEARAEAKAVKDLLSRLLANHRSNDASLPRASTGTPPVAAGGSAPAGDAGASTSAAMTFAAAVNTQPSSSRWFDDSKLKLDMELQQSLMKKDKSLHQTYMEAFATKPESISAAAFNSQFWSTRTNLLRAHAIEINQRKGPYNVLSTVKPRTVDGELKLNISVEQVQLIFAQHPLVKRIYNESVPKLSESEFWSRFFLSRLSKKLRGERVTDNDRSDPLFDRHDLSENNQGLQSKIIAQTIPHIIDLEANEENQGGFKSGNAKDVEMRPRLNIPIIETLNSLSEKIMANVAPSDVGLDGSGGSHDAFDELTLRDLQDDVQQQRIMLRVKEQNRLFAEQESTTHCARDRLQGEPNPAKVLSTVLGSLEKFDSSDNVETGLQTAIHFHDESDSDEDQEQSTINPPVGSRAAIKAAEKEVMDGVLQQRSQKYGHASDASSPMGLPAQLAERSALTHATSIEFLHQFWNAFLSGDADRATELQYLAESLTRSASRIHAVADEAERERETVIRKRKQEIRDHFERTGKKIRWKADMVGGGRDAVIKLTQPVLDALAKAQDRYGKALAAEGMRATTEA